MKIKWLTLSNIIVVFSVLLQISMTEAAKPPSTQILGSSDYAADVVINEVSVNSSFIELYFNETTDISGWSIFYDASGNSNSGSFEVCNATITSNPITSSCGIYSAGTFLLISNMPLHNTLQEILLVDNNTSPPSGSSAVHYFRYRNNTQSGGSVSWETSDPSLSTIYHAEGKKVNLCSRPDGNISSDNWEECNETPNETNTVVAIHHFEIDVIDGQGLTCEADNIIIKACADEDCTTSFNDAIDVKLSINDTFNKTVTVSGGSSETSFSYTTPGTATLSLDHIYECANGNPTDCDVSFADTGFQFISNTEDDPKPIPEQLSAKPSNIGFKKSTLKVQAIEKNTETGACQAAFIDTVNIEMAATCVDPDECAVSQVNINNLDTDTLIPTLDAGGLLSYNSVTLDFSDAAVNSAEFIFTYPDAGKVQLHARYNIRDENGDQTGNYMLGSSSAFVVRPLGFYINVDGNLKAQSATPPNDDIFIAAGEYFATSLTAVQWQAADDDLIGEANDGVPDTDADLSDNAVTVNFGNETESVAAVITDSLYLPNPGVLGDLTNDSFTDFSDGVATNGVDNDKSMTYDEVGIVSFFASLTSYLGAGDVTGVEPYVGRFIPHHFKLTGWDGEFKSTCDITIPSSVMTFAYVGQMSSSSSEKGALQYLSRPEVTITPQTLQNTHTQNYTGDFNKLLLSGISRFEVDNGTGTMVLAPIEDAERKGVDDENKIKLTANFTDGDLNENGGVLSFEYSAEDDFFYNHEKNAEIIPFISNINLSLASVVDEDGVTADDADNDPDGEGPILEADTVITLTPTGKTIRFGRAFLANSFGPETANLPQPFSMQYLKTIGNYVTNEQDTCTDFDADKITLTLGDLGENFTDVNTANGQFDDELRDGETRAMQLTAPGAGNQGKVGVEYEIYSWLKYDWDWNGVAIKSFDENPSAIATFGLFRGNDRIIYQREVNN